MSDDESAEQTPAPIALRLQMIALFRSLRLEDQDPAEYRKTVVRRIASAIAILASLMFAVVEFVAFESA